MDRIWRGDVLQEAWRRVKRNRGSAGVDHETLAEIEQYGVERILSELGEALRAGVRSRFCGDTSRRPMAGSGRSAFSTRRSETRRRAQGRGPR